MQLHPALADFRTELERLGFVVVCHGDYLCVRLPLLASVRVHLRDGQLHFDPQFGPVGRATALTVTPLAIIAGVGALAATTGIGAATFTAAVAGILAAIHDIGRLVLTEGCMTRLQLLWGTRAAPSGALSEVPRVGALRDGGPVMAATIGLRSGRAPLEQPSPVPVMPTDRTQ